MTGIPSTMSKNKCEDRESYLGVGKDSDGERWVIWETGKNLPFFTMYNIYLLPKILSEK